MNDLYRLLLLHIALFTVLSSLAEDTHSWEKYFYEVAAYEDNTMNEEDYETLCDMEDNKLNINTATREDLELLPFLTATQVEDISEYLYFHGSMQTLGELQLIKSLDYVRRQLLMCFVYAGEVKDKRPKLNDVISKGRNELMYSLRQPLYQRNGDHNGYLGYSVKHSFRYTFDSGDRLRLGLLGTQDSGEPFFSSKNSMGYDHYSYYMQMRKQGALENLIIGHYRLQFGMGLVANTGFSLGKTAMLTSLGRTTNAIRPSLSRSVADYMQGIAVTVRLMKPLTISTFASCRPIDATLNKDDGTMRTILTTGYHRTPSEMDKKNNSYATMVGMNAKYARDGFHIGVTTIYTHFNRNLNPLTTPLYRRYYTAGNDFVNASIDYGYTGHSVTMSGETATDKHGNVATINSVSATVKEGLSIIALHRYYSKKYSSLYANSFSDGGHVQNEHGMYIGIDWQPIGCLRINAYADYAHYSWPRYRVSHASDAFDTMLSAYFTLKRWTFSSRYRMRVRYRDNERKTAIIRYTGHKARLAANYDFGRGWSSTTQADVALTEYKSNDFGYMLSHSVNGQWRWLRLSASVNYFNTDSYESRLYTYERGPLHSFSFPSFYGHGLRYALMLRADIGRKLMALAKIGVTDYFDRSTIGSGLQQIDGSSVADVDVQFRWKF